MTGTPLVVLDACVLANFSLCDTLLRLAEPPRLFEPKWSEEIIRETTRTLELKLGWSNSLTTHLERELRAHFSEAWISGYDQLVSRMTNDEKDRHVVAAAVRGEAAIILTLNLRHFRPEHLAMWGVRALHPQSFLNYHRNRADSGSLTHDPSWPNTVGRRTWLIATDNPKYRSLGLN
jgi:predicted nucleic acid-binding protein